MKTTETKEIRLARQKKEWDKLIRDIKKDVAQSYHNKVQHDGYYQNVKVIESVIPCPH